jgi:prolyl oligopeptidase
VELTDPYAWMDGAGAPEVEAWRKREKDLARAALDANPIRAKFLERLHEHTRMPEVLTQARFAAGKLFFSHSPDHAGEGSLHLRDGLKGAERQIHVYRPAAAARHKARLGEWKPSPDGRLVAYPFLDAQSTAVATVYILNTTTGKWLDDAIEHVESPWVTWRQDGRSFYFTRRLPGPSGAPQWAVYLHTVGSAPGNDPVVLGVGSSTEPTGAWKSIEMFDTTGRQSVALARTEDHVSVYAAPRTSVTGARTRWRKVADAEQVRACTVRGDDVFLLTTRDTPQGKVIRVNLVRPEPGEVLVLPEGTAALKTLFPAADGTYVTAAEGAVARMMLVPIKGGAPAAVRLPLEGMIHRVVTDPVQSGALVEMSSVTSPRTFYRVGGAGSFDVVDVDELQPSDFSAVSVIRLAAKSADGTSVPLTIVQRSDLVRDGRRPAYIEPNAMGFGAPGPGYDPKRLAWLERGGVFACCHARPSVRGRDGLEKHRSVEDFIACAERLVAEGFTSPRRLGAVAEGTGAVGVAMAAIERPDLFGAASFRDGGFDLVGAVRGSSGAILAKEMGIDLGGPEPERGLQALLAVDAYARLQSGTRYPAMLLAMSSWARDSGAFKMAARIRAAQPDANTALVVDDDGAPGGFPRWDGVSMRTVASTADLYAFLFSQLASP